MENEESTIFTSPQCMSSAERSAVKSGELRGKRAAMAERPEHYGNIGSVSPKRFRENYDKIDWSKDIR